LSGSALSNLTYQLNWDANRGCNSLNISWTFLEHKWKLCFKLQALSLFRFIYQAKAQSLLDYRPVVQKKMQTPSLSMRLLTLATRVKWNDVRTALLFLLLRTAFQYKRYASMTTPKYIIIFHRSCRVLISGLARIRVSLVSRGFYFVSVRRGLRSASRASMSRVNEFRKPVRMKFVIGHA